MLFIKEKKIKSKKLRKNILSYILRVKKEIFFFFAPKNYSTNKIYYNLILAHSLDFRVILSIFEQQL